MVGRMGRVDVEQARLPTIMWVSKPVTRPDRRACPLIISHSRGCRSAGRDRHAGARQYRSLLDDLAQLADPRHRRGRRHTLTTVLAVAVAAVLAGARSLAAIGEWTSDAPDQVLAALGCAATRCAGWRPPSEATMRRVLARVDPDALDQAIGRWLADQQPPQATSRPPPRPAWRQAVAVDGKTLR